MLFVGGLTFPIDEICQGLEDMNNAVQTEKHDTIGVQEEEKHCEQEKERREETEKRHAIVEEKTIGKGKETEKGKEKEKEKEKETEKEKANKEGDETGMISEPSQNTFLSTVLPQISYYGDDAALQMLKVKVIKAESSVAVDMLKGNY
jgi:hypothetical protein